MEVRALSWNLFHGRDHPPDPALVTWRSRLLRATERNRTHAQVNRDLLDEFAAVLAAADWDVALLQECPPRWAEPLAAATGSAAHRALTSRNSLAPLRALVARINPDLVASNEGGSNLTLVRGRITERTELVLAAGPAARAPGDGADPRRARAGRDPVWVANLHASAGPALRSAAEREVLAAAERAGAWAAGEPLIFGGDLNLRPRDSGVYAELEERFGLRGPTATGALDHLLVRGLDPLDPPHQWPPERREVTAAGLAIRLSDHAPVEASFAVPATARGPGATAK